VGGTSAVAPLWAGLIARINQKLGTPTGFLNPLLYVQVANSNALNDITTGNNDITGKIGGYSAGPGWDACTGLGTANGTAIGNSLAAATAATPGR
jgi:kumamolisin